ncbi:unnamed protein product [Rhizophagus irregularis]|uniref:Uncharacterized protein n=1 Tax=Rhizophagus irregularis TaxID=588596 RepID=A0A916E4B4_9GLOM|nr:unnamed protein product [Rhizophagus irregularis]
MPHTNIISSFDELQKVSETTVNLFCGESSRKGASILDDDDVFSSDNYEDYHEDVDEINSQSVDEAKVCVVM